MYVERHTVVVETNGSGAATEYSPTLTGRVLQIRYVKGTFADTVDFAITVEGTGEGLWTQSDITASTTRAPRQATHGVDGAAAVYAESGEAVRDYIALANDRIKIVIANGGASKTGTFHFLIG